MLYFLDPKLPSYTEEKSHLNPNLLLHTGQSHINLVIKSYWFHFLNSCSCSTFFINWVANSVPKTLWWENASKNVLTIITVLIVKWLLSSYSHLHTLFHTVEFTSPKAYLILLYKLQWHLWPKIRKPPQNPPTSSPTMPFDTFCSLLQHKTPCYFRAPDLCTRCSLHLSARWSLTCFIRRSWNIMFSFGIFPDPFSSH